MNADATIPPAAVTLALLPLEVLSDAEGDERLARGFSEDLSAELARFPSLGVIAAESVLALDQDGLSEADVASRLGAGYLLRGAVRRRGGSLRISMQLVEAASGRHAWAARYDEANPLMIQDEIAAKVANALAISVDQSVLEASRRRHVTTLEAYECWLRGMECLQRGSAEADVEARAFFEQVLEIDPESARGYAGISLSHFNDWSCQTWSRWEEREALAYENAVRAEALDPNDAVVQLILARIEQYRREFDRAKPRLDRALQLAPNDSKILIQLAGGYSFHGEPELAWELAERSLELNPLCPGWFYSYAAMPLFALQRYEEALAVVSKSPPRGIVDMPAYQAAACALLGQEEAPARYLAEFREDYVTRISGGNEPGEDEMFRWVLHVNPYRREEDIEHLAKGLRLAGLKGSARRPGAGKLLAWPIANTFRREGTLWTVSFDHEVVQMPDLRGLHDLARLLGKPGEEIASADLAGAAVHERGIEHLDGQALHAYRERLREIDADVDEAENSGDAGRSEKLAGEREAILKEIGRATGLGGKVRVSGDAGEKARTAVTWRVRAAIKKITEVHPALGRHLSNSVRTGAFCSYQPEQTVDWRV